MHRASLEVSDPATDVRFRDIRQGSRDRSDGSAPLRGTQPHLAIKPGSARPMACSMQSWDGMDIQQLQYCGDLMRTALMADPISTIFGVCVWILQVIGDFTGMGYELANIVIFVIVHPALTIALFVLWRRARRKALECSIGLENGK